MSEERFPSQNSHPHPRRDTFAALFLTALLLALPTYYYFWNPAGSGGVALTCPTYHLTELHCPACGSQRALHALLHGRVLDAISFNVFAVFVLFPALGYMALRQWLRLWGFALLPELPLRRVSLLVLGGMAMAFAILRNLPYAPFNWLAP